MKVVIGETPDAPKRQSSWALRKIQYKYWAKRKKENQERFVESRNYSKTQKP